MEPGGSMPHSQGLSNNPYREPINPIPRIDTYFFKVHSNIVLPSTPTLVQYYTGKLYNIFMIASCTIWMWNMVSYIKGGTQIKGIWKQDPIANIWAQKGWEWGVEKAPQWGNSEFSVIKSRRLRRARHVARLEEGMSAFKILTGFNRYP